MYSVFNRTLVSQIPYYLGLRTDFFSCILFYRPPRTTDRHKVWSLVPGPWSLGFLWHLATLPYRHCTIHLYFGE